MWLLKKNSNFFIKKFSFHTIKNTIISIKKEYFFKKKLFHQFKNNDEKIKNNDKIEEKYI